MRLLPECVSLGKQFALFNTSQGLSENNFFDTYDRWVYTAIRYTQYSYTCKVTIFGLCMKHRTYRQQHAK